MGEVRYAKKLTAKELLGNPVKHIEGLADGETKFVYSLGGIASGVKTGTTQYGEWTALLGEFVGIVLDTGEEIRASKCFIQEPLQSFVLEQMKADDQVEFCAKVGIRRRNDLERKYEYILAPLMDTQAGDDRLNKLKALMAGVTQPVLTPPDEIKAGEPEADETPKKGGKTKAA